MKKTLTIIFLVFIASSFKIYAQSNKSANTINISVVMPEEDENLDQSQISKLKTKIIRVAESAGITSLDGYSNFVIYPKFEVYGSNVVEGGMQNIVVTKINLNLIIKQVDNNLIFSTITQTLIGSGISQSIAFTNAISNIDVNDNSLKKFVENGKVKILNYYNTNCNSILANAENFAQKKDYKQAISLTAQIPESANCYLSAQSKSIAYYKFYQNTLCAESIKQANVSIASNDYSNALNSLSEIEPNSSCSAEAKVLLKKIETKINAEEKRDYDLKVKIYTDAVSLEKYRVKAIRDIAVSYYKNSRSMTYQYIIR